MRHRLVLLAVVATTLALVAAPGSAAQPVDADAAGTDGTAEGAVAEADAAATRELLAAAASPQRAVPVAPGVQRLEYRFAKASGAPVAAQVLTVARRDDVRVTSELARGAVPGLETVAEMNRRIQPRGGVAVVNSGFWLNQPVGDPNSYFATGGRLVSESETQGAQDGSPQRGTRGTFAVTTQGIGIVDRIDAQVHLRTSGSPIRVRGVNRLNRTTWFNADGADALYLYTPDFGGQVTLPAGGDRGPAVVLNVAPMSVAASGEGTPAVVPAHEVHPPGATIPIRPDGVVVVGYGGAGEDLRRLAPGTLLQAVTQVDFPAGERARPDVWREVAEGVAAGPLIVRDGQPTPRASWEIEGFPGSHNDGTAPRSAVGVRADGTVLLAAVDGRQFRSGDPANQHSAGFTMAELARFMIDLGAVDALALDGGGSTQLSVDGIQRNRSCEALGACGRPRPVASGIAVVHDYEATATRRLSGSGREATAAAAALAAHPQGATEAVLAPGGNFPDALAGGPLAAALGGPLLLTSRDAVAAVTRDALRTLGVRRVTLLGGTGVLSGALAEQLAREGYQVRRLAGPGRVETSAAIAGALGDRHERVVLASAGGFADALSAAAPAGILRSPIVLTGRDDLHPAARQAIAAARPAEVLIVGGTGVIADRVRQQVEAAAPGVTVTRLAGRDRFGTARAINEWAEATIPDLDLGELVVARGDAFPDALAGGPFAASARRLLMIVPSNDVRAAPDAAAYLDRRGEGPLERVTLLGGLGVISSYQQWQLDQLAR